MTQLHSSTESDILLNFLQLLAPPVNHSSKIPGTRSIRWRRFIVSIYHLFTSFANLLDLEGECATCLQDFIEFIVPVLVVIDVSIGLK